MNQLKINVDASVVSGQNSFAVGLVIRNHRGHYIAGKVIRFAGVVSVLCGIWEAILWFQGFAGESISVESDSLINVNAINHGHDNNILEIGDLVQQCQQMLKSTSRVSVSYVNRCYDTSELNCFYVISSPPSLSF